MEGGGLVELDPYMKRLETEQLLEQNCLGIQLDLPSPYGQKNFLLHFLQNLYCSVALHKIPLNKTDFLSLL